MLAALRRILPALSVCAALLLPGAARAVPAYDGLVVFGDSTADSGNAFLALSAAMLPSTTPVPVPTPPGNAFVPDAPYARTPPLLPAFSDGPVWGEVLAQALGLPPLAPSLAGGTNFAFGGARMRVPAPVPSPSVPQQVDAFIAGLDALSAMPGGPDAPPDALYVIFAGGNDVRDAIGLALSGGNPADVQAGVDAIVDAYGLGLAGAVGDLALEGARDFLVAGVPDLGLTPAVTSLGPAAVAVASAVSAQFNERFEAVMLFLQDQFAPMPAFADARLSRFDVAGVLRSVAANPAGFGLANVTDVCVADPACLADPSGHLFWDGIHVTGAAHRILAASMLSALASEVPAPATLALLGASLVLARRRRSRARAAAGRAAVRPGPPASAATRGAAA